MKRVAAALGVALVLAACASASARSSHLSAAGSDWPRFGYDAARHNSGPAATRVTASTVHHLERQTVTLDGTVDSSAIYLHAARIGGRAHDAFFVTTTYGKTEAIDADSGAVLWRYTPQTYESYAGGTRITTAAPVADPNRRAVYAAAPDGRITKLSVADGSPVWSTAVTLDPTHEKLTSALNFSRGLVIVTTGGFIGDIPPYQGHVVTLRASDGKIVAVWNSLCSNRHTLIQPSTCNASDSAIWARSGAVVDPHTGDLIVATGNGPWNGKTNWGDSVVVLSPTASKLLGHWTPLNQSELERRDLDIGSAGPALLAGGRIVQGGKDRKLRLISLTRMRGSGAHLGGELHVVSTPRAAPMFTVPAAWRSRWLFVATYSGTAAWRLAGDRLQRVWINDTAGSSPVVAGGLLYVAGTGALNVYNPTTGRRVAALPYGTFHWQSPIVADGRIALAEGDSNHHRTSGVLNIYRVR